MSPARTLLTRDGHSIYVEAPEVVTTKQGIFLLGSPTFVVTPTGRALLTLDEASPKYFAGAIIRDSNFAELLPSPADVAVMSAPRAAVSPTGTVEILWMPADSTGLQGSGTNLFSSRWTGTGWSQTAKVPGVVNPGVWNRTQTSRSVYAAGVPWIIGVPNLEAAGLGRSFVWTHKGWLSVPSEGAFGPYTSVAPSEDTVRTMAYVDYGAPDGNAVYVRRSFTGGRTWGAGSRVSAPGSGSADWPQLLQVDGGQLALVWQAARGISGGTIQIAISTDRGGSWKMQPPFEVSGAIATLRAVADRAGRIHVIVELRAPKHRATQPFYVQWSDRQWRAAWAAPDSTASFGIATIGLGVDASTVIATWGENDRKSTSSRTKMLTIVTHCAK